MVSLIPSDDGLTVNSVFLPSFPTASLGAPSSAEVNELFSLLITSFSNPFRDRPGDFDDSDEEPRSPLPGDGAGRELELSPSLSVLGRCDLALSLLLLSRLFPDELLLDVLKD